MVCGRTGPGPPRHTHVTLTSIGIVNGGSHLGVSGGVSGTHFQPLPSLTHTLSWHAGSDRISGHRQNNDAGKSEHPTDGDTGDAGGAGLLTTGWPDDGPPADDRPAADGRLAAGDGRAATLALGPESDAPSGWAAQADPADRVNVAMAPSATALVMIFIGISPVSSAKHRGTSETVFGGAAPAEEEPRRPPRSRVGLRRRRTGYERRRTG